MGGTKEPGGPALTLVGADEPDADSPGQRRRAAMRPRHFVALPYGWPLTALFTGLGLWWAVGLSELAVIVFAIPMALHVWRERRTLRVPRGWGLWVLFVLWTMASFLMLDLDPPGTLPDSLIGRMLPWAYRAVSYLTVTAILIYVGTLDRRRYTQEKIARVLGIGFVWVALGGYLGTFAPTLEFTSPVEMLMPAGLRANPFVQSLVHPAAAQVQDFLGYAAARPAAPFGYTNVWGHAFAMLLPWFVVAFVVRANGMKRLLGLAFAAASLYPAIASLNRGLWIGLGLCGAYLVVRQLMRGRPTVAAGALVAVAVAGGVVVLSPLGGLIQERLDNGHSNAIRDYTIERSIEVAATSPVLGLGNTRVDSGSHNSIMVGRTADCPTCGNVNIGINGHLWFELVAHGFVGAALYVGTIGTVFWRYRRDHTAIGYAAHLGVGLMLWFMFVYGAIPTPLAIAFVGWGVLWRNAEARAEERT